MEAKVSKFININDKTKKSITLFLTMLFSIVVGIGISVINTRYLGKEQYGDFKFILNIYSFIVTFLTFGLFYSGGRILAQLEEKREQRELFGELIIISFGISLLFMLFVLIFSLVQPKIYDFNLGRELRLFLPLLFIFPLQLSLEQLLQGNNRIYSLSFFRIAPKVIYVALVMLLFYTMAKSTGVALFSHLVAFAIAILVVILIQKPIFSFKFKFLKRLISENKKYGFQIYLGNISGVASFYIAGISIGYFVDNINVGFYSLAITATLPLSMLPVAFGTTYFKSFVKMDYIPNKLFISTIAVAIIALSSFCLIIKKVVILIYSEEFLPIVSISYYLAFGAACHGIADFFNRFLGAKGLGKNLRNSNFFLGVVNIIGYTLLVKFLGVDGAALTRFLAGIFYLIIMLFYYFRFLKETRRKYLV